MKEQVILLNGPSSSGKSTLAKALQNLITIEAHKRCIVVSIDDFMKISQTETIYEDDVFEISGDMCAKALELLEAGFDIIIDHGVSGAGFQGLPGIGVSVERLPLEGDEDLSGLQGPGIRIHALGGEEKFV